ncbi:MAG TPA: hypothetical protein VFX59_06060 [Polyangiales bacterium]|nr:hypothetical protein [Polyangiales bacterium]
MNHVSWEVHLWWAALGAVSLINLVLWGISARAFLRKRSLENWNLHATRWPHLVLSAVYVVVCGFRSVLPRADVQRIVLYDSWLSSVFVGRSVATVAELCFAAQWALLLHELASSRKQTYGMYLARAVVPMIVVAEICSWYAVLTTSYLGNTLEQSIWTGTVALMIGSLIMLMRESSGPLKSALRGGVIACTAFVVFMCAVDVRMYLTRFIADEAAGRKYLPIVDGLHDVATRWVVTHSMADWSQEMAWMGLYFSVCVWISIALLHAPRFEHGALVPVRKTARVRASAVRAEGVPAE